jgi:hypothetical protein
MVLNRAGHVVVPQMKRNDLKPLDLKSEGCDFSEKTLSRARYVLRNNPIADGKRYPDRCLAIMAGMTNGF